MAGSERRLPSRRTFVGGGLVLGAAAIAGSTTLRGALASGDAPFISETVHRRSPTGLLGFAPAPLHDGPAPAISADYDYEVMLPWGTPIQPDGPAFVGAASTPESAQLQVGFGHDGMWFFPLNGSSDHGMMCINHEFGPTTGQVATHQAYHGISVVEIARADGSWQVVASERARRITPSTPVNFGGPAAGHPLLSTAGSAPAGTVNNCAGGATPWGTYLSAEENFNVRFGALGPFTPSLSQQRYGLAARPTGWMNTDPRFDLSDPTHRNEANRWGWVVEVDPMAPDVKPRKLTALGRFKHEGVACTLGAGQRAVIYMGDDQQNEYIYKFVAHNSYQVELEAGRSPLDDGQLYAARFDPDGSGEWLELDIGNPLLAERFSDQAEVLVLARLAATLVGATPMARPEWTCVDSMGRVYCSLTAGASHGQILRWLDDDDHVGTTFEWHMFLDADDTWRDANAGFGSPDGLWADPNGRLFIETDGGQPGGSNNQLLVADTFTGETRRLFVGPEGCEITGITQTPNQRTLFVNVQHPSGVWPELGGPAIARDATVAITRKDGGVVGS